MEVLKPKILAISGGISSTSYNRKIITRLKIEFSEVCDILINDDIVNFPFFDSGISEEETPNSVKLFLEKVKDADAVLICSPEYVYSIPGVLKNALEWSVASVVFTDKPVALITAATVGNKAHESLILILKTIGAKLTDKTNLLVSGVKGKISADGQFIDDETKRSIYSLMQGLLENIG
ncbi:NADPH-dependent FMN reductase [Leptospira sp. WS39.C2]